MIKTVSYNKYLKELLEETLYDGNHFEIHNPKYLIRGTWNV
jgi:hypothetical protein